MRALSLLQPWAWLVIHGGKTIENRTWTTRFRGRLLIHASKRRSLDDWGAAMQLAFELGGDELVRRIPRPGLIFCGGVVGVAELVDVLEPMGKPTVPWHMPGAYGFVLRGARPLAFHPCAGALGLWQAPEGAVWAGAAEAGDLLERLAAEDRGT